MYRQALFTLLGLVLVSSLLQFTFGSNPISTTSHLLAQASAGAGVSVGIAQNPVNSLMSELQRRERAIALREESVIRKELRLDEKLAVDGGSSRAVYAYLALTAGVLLLLIGTNFYFDYRRSHPHHAV